MQNIRSFLDNLGHCRFSAFYPTHDENKKRLVEMVSQVAVGIFALLGLYDLVENSLPFIAKVVVYGTLLAIIGSLAISKLLDKLIPPPSKPKVEAPIPQKVQEETSKKIEENEIPESPVNKRPNVKRSLLPEFNEEA